MSTMVQEPKGKKKNQIERAIEYHLRHYRTYLVGIKNLEKQLDWILPSAISSYDMTEGGGSGFSIKSTTEDFAIDRIESKRALDIHEEKERYELIVRSIDAALEDLDETEKAFVKCRYFEDEMIEKCALQLGYARTSLYDVRRRVMDRLMISLKGVLEL